MEVSVEACFEKYESVSSIGDMSNPGGLQRAVIHGAHCQKTSGIGLFTEEGFVDRVAREALRLLTKLPFL